MPIYEVTLTSEFQGQQCINRWNYVSAGVPAVVTGSFGLISAMMGGSVQPAEPASGSLMTGIMLLVTNGVKFLGLTAKNIYDVEDFYERPFVPALWGQIEGDGMPPFVAYGLRTNRVRQDIARATKRFVGASETLQNNGTLIGAAVTNLQMVATRMSEALVYDDEGNTITYMPAVVKKEAYTTPSGGRAYRYMADEAAQLANTALGVVWQPYGTLRSQTSRQFGRGQ